MNRGQIISDLRNMIGPSSEVDGTGLATWVNDAYMQMCDAVSEVNPDYFAGYDTADTEAGDQESDVPEDFERAIKVEVTYDGSTWVSASPLQNINQLATLSRPESNSAYTVAAPAYYILGDQIGLVPVPSTSIEEAIRLWYVYTPSELSSDSDVPALPAKYHHIIKLGAYANYLDQDDQDGHAERIRNQFDKRVDKMASSMSQNQVNETKSVLITTNQDSYMDSDYV